MTTALTGVVTSPVNMKDRKDLGIKAGDTVRVHQKIQDKDKTRIQIFEGLVLARKHGNEAGATFTVRKIASGVGVEKIFPLYSPAIDKIEIIKRAKVRRSKLYYIREKVAREIKRQMRRMHLVTLATESEMEAKTRAEAKEKEVESAKISEESETSADKEVKEESTTPDTNVSAEADKETEEPEVDKKAEGSDSEEEKEKKD